MSTFRDVCDLETFRDCRDEVVPREIVGKIIEAGRSAPSPGNVDSLEFIVVESDEKKEILHRATDDERVLEAPTLVVVLSDQDRMRRRIRENAGEYCSAEAACAIQNMRVVASSEGLASCWISGFDRQSVRRKFSVPEGKVPMGVVLLGYTDKPVESGDKFGMNEICFYDEYGNQIETFWDGSGWRGLEEEARIQEKKVLSMIGRVRRGVKQLL